MARAPARAVGVLAFALLPACAAVLGLDDLQSAEKGVTPSTEAGGDARGEVVEAAAMDGATDGEDASDGGVLLDGDASAAPDVDADAPDARTPDRVVFVTNGAWDGNLGGLAGADVKCNEAADLASPGLGSRRFKAWLSTGTQSAMDRFVDHGPRPIVDVFGGTIADHWTALVNVNVACASCLKQPINKTETRNVLPAGDLAWTATQPNGTGGGVAHCGGWTNTSMTGGAGNPAATDYNWTATSGESCSTVRHLYCLQDD